MDYTTLNNHQQAEIIELLLKHLKLEIIDQYYDGCCFKLESKELEGRD